MVPSGGRNSSAFHAGVCVFMGGRGVVGCWKVLMMEWVVCRRGGVLNVGSINRKFWGLKMGWLGRGEGEDLIGAFLEVFGPLGRVWRAVKRM